MTRIPTRRNIVQRALSRLGQECHDHQWIPFVAVIVLLAVLNIYERTE